jgi:hypothetical protein
VDPLPEFAGGTWTEVLEAQRSAGLERIEVAQVMPMGPRGLPGPTGPAGPKGNSTEWTVGHGDPVFVDTDTDEGEIYMDADTGNVFVVKESPPGSGLLVWAYEGNIFGPTGATGPAGPTGLQGPLGPTGPLGPAGPVSQLTVGTVVPVPSGTPPRVEITGSPGAYTLNWWLERGLQGPAGSNIVIRGMLPDSGPPSPTNPVSGAAANPAPGDGWVAANRNVWVWTTNNGWIDVGPVQGPVGPTGPAGLGFQYVTVPLNPRANGDGTLIQDIAHALPNPYPVVRVLLEEANGIMVDAQSVYVYYTSPNDVHIILDASAHGLPGKVVLT